MRAVLLHFAQAERPDDRFDHGVVDSSAYRRPCVGRAVGREDEFPAAALADRNGDADGDGYTKSRLRRRALAFLAHHNRNVVQQSSFSITEAKKTMAQFLRDSEGLSQQRSTVGADELLGVTSETAGLLVEKAPGEIAFVHSLFEEVLAGEHLSGLDLQAQCALMQAHSGDHRWTNVLLSLVHQLTRAQDVDSLSEDNGELIGKIRQRTPPFGFFRVQRLRQPQQFIF